MTARPSGPKGSDPASRFLRVTLAGALVALALLFDPPLDAQSILTPDPDPFRREDEIEGRDFEYEEESFLHRFSYRFRPEEERLWSADPEGFRGTAGSVRSDEFYVAHEIRKSIELDSPVSFLLRHRRDEDFDGAYDRTLTGLGVGLGSGWSGAALAEVVGDKEDIDIHLELEGRGERGRARAAIVIVDATYDSKSDTGSYDRRPFTFFVEGEHRFEAGAALSAWVNLNPHTVLEDEVDDFRFVYDRYSGEVDLRVPLGDGWSGWLSAGGETGERDRTDFLPTPTDVQDLTRRHFQTTARLECETAPGRSWWGGARWFRLDERDRRPGDPLDRDLRFREAMVFGGATWRLSERVLLWPSIYLEVVDDVETFANDPGSTEDTEGFVGKAALPLELALGKGATATIQVGMFLHEARFGGAGVQFRIPF